MQSVTKAVDLANHLSEIGDLSQAEALFQLALTDAQSGDDPFLAAFVLNELTHFYENHGQQDKANALWAHIRNTLSDAIDSGAITISDKQTPE